MKIFCEELQRTDVSWCICHANKKITHRPPPGTRMHGSIMGDVFIKSKQTLIKGEWCDACMRQPPLRVLLYCAVLAHLDCADIIYSRLIFICARWLCRACFLSRRMRWKLIFNGNGPIVLDVTVTTAIICVFILSI